MLGHEVTFTETNAKAWIPLCECGWYGTAHPRYPGTIETPIRRAKQVEHAQDACRAEHARHLLAETRKITDEHALALASHTRFIETARPVVTRVGRWGRG